MCSEVLGFESGGNHVTMEILPHEVSEPESNLLHIHEKIRSHDRLYRQQCHGEVPTKLPFTLHASRVDRRLRLSCMHPPDSVDELKVASNGKKDVEDHAKGNHGEKNVEYISSKAKVGEESNLTGCGRSSGNGSTRRMRQVVCSEVLGMERSASHVAMEILPHEISQPESKLPHICEKRRLAKEPRPPLPTAMPWKGKHRST
uniref:Uncharacterized protein n=1 Tax=Oryza punctata TaxID=4537 RepID=A0A0E0MN46_ORYPU